MIWKVKKFILSSEDETLTHYGVVLEKDWEPFYVTINSNGTYTYIWAKRLDTSKHHPVVKIKEGR